MRKQGNDSSTSCDFFGSFQSSYAMWVRRDLILWLDRPGASESYEISSGKVFYLISANHTRAHQIHRVSCSSLEDTERWSCGKQIESYLKTRDDLPTMRGYGHEKPAIHHLLPRLASAKEPLRGHAKYARVCSRVQKPHAGVNWWQPRNFRLDKRR